MYFSGCRSRVGLDPARHLPHHPMTTFYLTNVFDSQWCYLLEINDLVAANGNRPSELKFGESLPIYCCPSNRTDIQRQTRLMNTLDGLGHSVDPSSGNEERWRDPWKSS